MDQQTAIAELKKLSAEVDAVTELAALKPIYFHLDQISKQFPGDFDVQVVASELKQRLVSHGQKLKDAALGATGVAPVGAVPQPPPPPPMGAGPLSSGQTPAYSPVPPPPPPQTPAAVATPPSMQVPTPSGSGQAPSGSRPTSFQTAAGQLPPPRKGGGGGNFKRALMIGAGIGLVAFAAIFVLIVQVARKKNPADGNSAGGALVTVEVTTTPPGAQVQISNQERQEKCTSNCKIQLPPGNYQVTALLEGYDPTATGVTVAAGPPIPVSLALTAQAQTLRILSDIGGKVSLDGKPAGDVQEGQFILDRVTPGDHTVTVSGPGGDATFSFHSESGKAPRMNGPATAKNLLAVFVAGAANQAKLHTSSGPLKVQLDGQGRGDASPAGVDLTGLAPGEHELIVGEGKDSKKIILSFAQTPMLTAYLKSDVNAGFLVVVTGQEDDVSVTVDGRAMRSKTSRGQLRVQLAPGKYKVKAAKDGFADAGEQVAEIKKGEESKIAFTLKALPRMATLRVTGATPGASVSLDRNVVGKVNPDGTFSSTVSQLGDKVVEFSLAGYSTKTYNKSFKAGERVDITDAVLAQAVGTLRLVLSPADSRVTFRKDGEQPRNVTESTLSGLTPGVYVLTARAAGYTERTERVTLNAGDNKPVDLALKKEAVVVQAPVVRNGTIADLDGNASRDGDAYVFKGTSNVMFKADKTGGTFTFSIRPVRGKRIRWMIGFKDSANYALFELEKNKFTRRDVAGGRDKKLTDSGRIEQQDVFQVQIDVRNGSVVHKVNIGGNWTVVDNWVDAGRNFADGKFGFRIDGKDEIAITDFKFVPAR